MNSSSHHPSKSIVVQQGLAAQQLFLLFHGVGAQPESMLGMANLLASEFPTSMIVSVAAPHACDLGVGYQWFSVSGVTEENRPQRVRDAMPLFAKGVLYWQNKAQLDSARTALIGFSQGAIMALEASRLQPQLAARIVAHSGRFASLPETIATNTTLHLLHGKNDSVIPYQHCVEAAHKLQALGSDFTADVIPHLDHAMSPESMRLVVENLKSYLPRHAWAQALETGVPSKHASAQA